METGVTKEPMVLIALLFGEDPNIKITFSKMVGFERLDFNKRDLLTKSIADIMDFCNATKPVYYHIETLKNKNTNNSVVG